MSNVIKGTLAGGLGAAFVMYLAAVLFSAGFNWEKPDFSFAPNPNCDAVSHDCTYETRRGLVMYFGAIGMLAGGFVGFVKR